MLFKQDYTLGKAMCRARVLFILFMATHSWVCSLYEPLNEEEKASLQQLTAEASSGHTNSSLLHFKLALLYHRDQEQEKGFYYFVKALELAKPHANYVPSEQDNVDYQEALGIYLAAQGTDVQQGCNIILKRYADKVAQNASLPQLSFIVAAAFANKGDYINSHKLFYASYGLLPEHYLAHKMLAILHLKLMEKLMPGKERQNLQLKIEHHLKKAIQAEPSDPLLYKLWLLHSPVKEKQTLIRQVLEMLTQKNVVINRADLSFFIGQGLLLEDLSTLKSFILKAKERLPHSRLLAEAEKNLEIHRP